LNKIFIVSIFGLINVFFANIALGQNQLTHKSYNQDKFEKNKVFDEVYHLRWHKNNWWPNAKDTLPYFVDDRNYKGIVNYGVTFRRRDYKNFQFLESNSMYFLKVEFSKCDFNPRDSVINIEGFVSGGWDKVLKKGKIQNNIDIFLGEKTDTVSACYLGNACYDKIINKETVEAKLNNKEIDEFTILDTFPSFYIKNYSYYRTDPEGRRPFKISGKVTKSGLLAFGSRGCYSEIFDLGSMIYSPNKNKREKNTNKEGTDGRTLMINNRLVSDIGKEKTQKGNTNYYTYTKNAENYIIARQYVKAKEEYNLLNQNYFSVFARDIHNAARCAILSRDLKSAFWWGEKLAFKGIELSYFNSKIFNVMRKNPEWKNFSIKYDSIYKLTKSKWNLKLKKELTDLLNEDQVSYGLENRKDQKALYDTTERVTGKLIEILKREGFPSEEKIGSYVKNDTVLVPFPDFNVLIRHAMQQNPKNLAVLNELLDKSIEAFEYDSNRSFNNATEYDSCFHIYKGNLYNSKSCGRNDLEVRRISFKFSNPNRFIMDYGNFVISEYNSKNPKEGDDYYEQNYNFIMKLSEDWEFYEK
jgi:hypothetical protein